MTAGSSLVELDSLVTTQKAQADAQKALDALKKKLETGRLKGKAAADLQAKITEKQNKIGELEAQSKNAKLLADKDVQVDKVLVTKGQAVTAGTDAVSILEKGLIAELKVASTDSASLSEGQKVSLTNASKSVSLKGSIKSIAKQDDGSLVPRSRPDALIHGAAASLAHVLAMLEAGALISVNGTHRPTPFGSICVHGDSPEAVATARVLRAGLLERGYRLAGLEAIAAD